MNGWRGRYILFFWLAFLIVMALNILVWLYLNQVENRFKSQLHNHLSDVQQVMNELITVYSEDVDPASLVPGQNSGLNYIFYQQALERIRRSSNIQSILLLSTNGQILVSAPERLVYQRMAAIASGKAFDRALAGETVVTDIHNYAGEQFMSALTAIRNIDGFITSVLVVEVRAGFFGVLNSLRNRLLLFSILNVALILLIALLLFRMLQRSMHYQAELQKQQNLVQLGTMAATVAHEIRNPLSIIEGTNDLIRKKFRAGEDPVFDYIPDEIKRLNTLIDNFLTFARTPQIRPQEIDLGRLTDRLKLSLAPTELNRFKITGLPVKSFISDEKLMEQILLNLIQNAFQAGDAGNEVELHLALKSRHRLWIEVLDRGEGIPNEIEKQIFDPFFTTREKGTGLGLAITAQLVRHLNGRIRFEKRPGGGTIFIIELINLKSN